LEVLDSGKWWFGEKIQRFESEFAEFQGARYAVSCTNGTAAIEMALPGLGRQTKRHIFLIIRGIPQA